MCPIKQDENNGLTVGLDFASVYLIIDDICPEDEGLLVVEV